MTTTRNTIAEAVTANCGISQRDANECVTRVLEEVARALIAGDRPKPILLMVQRVHGGR